MRARELAKQLLRRKRKSLDHWQSRYSVGRGTYGEPNILEWDRDTTLQVGKFCSIAGNVTLALGGNHTVDWITTYPFSESNAPEREFYGAGLSRGDIVIGNDVWIGTQALILSGVVISDGAVIGAGAVVTRDVPPYGIVVGNPAKLVRTRFATDEVATLLELQWWDWDDDKIRAGLAHLFGSSVNQLKDFSDAYDRRGSI